MCDMISKIPEAATNGHIAFVSVLPLSHHYEYVCTTK